MTFLDTIPPEQFTILATLIGVILSQDLTAEEQNSVGNFIVSIGQSMLTLVAQAANQKSLQAQQDQNEYLKQQLHSLTEQIKILQKQVER